MPKYIKVRSKLLTNKNFQYKKYLMNFLNSLFVSYLYAKYLNQPTSSYMLRFTGQMFFLFKKAKICKFKESKTPSNILTTTSLSRAQAWATRLYCRQRPKDPHETNNNGTRTPWHWCGSSVPLTFSLHSHVIQNGGKLQVIICLDILKCLFLTKKNLSL